MSLDTALTVAQAAAALVGGYTLVTGLLSVLNFVYRQFLRPGKDLKRYGKWAVVTGGTDGIGKAYAEALAKKGLSVLIISRTEEKLKAACAEIKEKYPNVDTNYVVADLCRPTEATWAAISEAVKKVEGAGILINNAGMSYEHPEYLDLLPEERINDLIQINATSLTQMCKIVIPGMKERRTGAIVNISSAASFGVDANPMLSVYAGSKAYVETMTQGLAAELGDWNIDVQVQPPWFVTSKLSKIRRASATVPTPKAYVAAAIRHIGYEDVAVPFPAHAALYGVLRSLPSAIVTPMALSQHKGIRKKAYAKKEKAQ